MAEINGYNISNSVFENLSLPKETTDENPNNSLGQADFLQLLITQLENQNPLQPQDGTEFVAQLAQFSVVQGIEKMNLNFAAMSRNFQSSQAIQASSLVGRTVLVDSGEGRLAADGVLLGAVELPEPVDDLLINIYNSSGVLVRRDVVGGQDRGEFRFAWDGLTENGTRAAPGQYRIEALGLVDNETVALATAISANVNSVTLGKSGAMTLNVDGVGPIQVTDVKEIL